MQSYIKTNTIVKTLKIIDCIGEDTFNEYIDNIISDFDGNENIKDFIIKLCLEYFSVSIGVITKSGRINKNASDARDVCCYLLYRYTNLKQLDIAFIMKVNYVYNISKWIKNVKNLSTIIPYEKALKKKVEILEKIIKTKIDSNGNTE